MLCHIIDEEEKETIKANVLHILKENYGIEEEDFASAELEIVPAGKARDCGFDRSMILSYGQDDRVCAFTSLFAMLDVENAKRTGCCLLVDKEEIGSVGATVCRGFSGSQIFHRFRGSGDFSCSSADNSIEHWLLFCTPL